MIFRSTGIPIVSVCYPPCHHKLCSKIKAGAEFLGPPISSCTNPTCNAPPLALLGEENVVEARLYTLRRGVLPVFSKSRYCRFCRTRYYNNYFVCDAKEPTAKRQYYSEEIPKFIHVTETSFVDPELCTYIRVQMAIAQQVHGISRVYNAALGMSHLPEQSRLHLALNGDLVLDAFLLHAILHDKHKRRETLSLPHTGYQNHRFDEELAARNYRMAGTGQDMWAHACHRCMKIYQGEDGRWYRLTAGVHDGVNVRHLCCGVHDCFEALPSQRAHFCQTHSHLAQICGVQGCNLAAEPGFRTCTTESHRALQKDADERNTAICIYSNNHSQHKCRSRPFHCTSLYLKAKLTRSWTHNEQLFVRCCGIIISRATLFGSESVTGTKVFLKATFPPEYPGSKPTYVFYDNNCSLLKHLRSSGDHYFNDVGLPVDVFHFKCKHSEGDVFCQTHCNPARFGELIGADGKWIFNSSAAEQANVWFGKYQNIVQDMPTNKLSLTRYNFYLDEMIAIHNEQLATQLRAEGQAPHLQSESLLRGGFPFLKSDVINVETQ
ncbi:hypothetical protein C8R43DRAFT_902319 [Mycena crocata]|nr:hypothetical protein C8R43DRAFT_902319 [Mycena crocata]